MSNAQATDLRQRAQRLRALAHTIEQTPAMGLERHGADDTWRGARPRLCLNLLGTNQAQLHHESDRLRWQAYLFEQQAELLDQQAAVATGRVS